MPPPENIHLGRGRHAEPIDSTEPVAANPAAMRTYSTDAPEKTAELRTLIGEAATALANYRQNAILSGAGFRGRSIEWDNAWTDTQGTGNSATDALLELCDDFDHLDAFVGSVADAIYEAEDLDDQDPQADQLHHLTAGDIAEHGDINDARREFANEDAQTDVQELRALFEAVDVNFEDFTGGTIYLPDGELNRELYDQLAVMVEQMSEDEYASTMFNELGAPGTRAILDYISRVSNGQDRYDTLPDDLDITTDLLLPFAEGFATASHTLDESTREDLLDVGDSWRTHLHLTMLLSGDGSHYESQFLADAAEIVLVSERSSDFSSDPQPYPWMSEALVSRQTLLETLGENPEAAWLFVNSDPENLKYILEGPPEGDEQAAQVFEAAFLQAPLKNPEIYPEALDLYADVVRIVGDGNIPVPLRIAVSGSLVLYIDDIGTAALTQRRSTYNNDEAREAEDFNRPELRNFFQELGYNEEAAMLVGVAIMSWSADDLHPFVTEPGRMEENSSAALQEQALIMGTIQDGFDRADDNSMGWLATGVNLVASVGLAAMLAMPEPTSTGVAASVLAGNTVGRAAGGAALGWSIPPLSEWVSGEAADTEDLVDGSAFQDLMVGNLVEGTATTIAEGQGMSAPDPSEYDSILNSHFPGVHPISQLETQAFQEHHHDDPDRHWDREGGS